MRGDSSSDRRDTVGHGGTSCVLPHRAPAGQGQVYIDTCPAPGRAACLSGPFVPPSHPDALDLDLLAFFGGQWGAFCPWPTPQQAAADLREFFGGANDTATAARLEPGIFPQVTQ